MRILLFYNELWDKSHNYISEYLQKHHNYGIIVFSELLKLNISKKSVLGLQISETIKKGQNVSHQLLNDLVTHEIKIQNFDNLILYGYPNSETEIEEFKIFCNVNQFKIGKIVYFKSLNTLECLRKDEYHSSLIQKYESEDYMVKSVFTIRDRISSTLISLNLDELIVTFESEPLGKCLNSDQFRLDSLISEILKD